MDEVDEYLGQFTQVLNNHTLNEIRGGKAVFGLSNANLTTWSKHWQAANGINTGSPRITFNGFAIGGNQFYLRNDGFFTPSVKSGQTFTRTANGVPPDIDLDHLP